VDKLGRVVSLGFTPDLTVPDGTRVQENKYACGELEYQVEQYFEGEREHFTLELRLEGTGFQKAVWSRLVKTDYGTTVTYGEIAQKIGRRNAARAVGNAVAANPVVIIVPCHRVVPARGGIGNYARRALASVDGRQVKRFLLSLESSRSMFE
jgi:methylated-DNA-[protein]-cysteine S-methyltransferase